MITRGEIIMLGIASGLSGCLIGGILLGIGMVLVDNGESFGWLLLLPGAPIAAIIGLLLGYRLAQQL